MGRNDLVGLDAGRADPMIGRRLAGATAGARVPALGAFDQGANAHRTFQATILGTGKGERKGACVDFLGGLLTGGRYDSTPTSPGAGLYPVGLAENAKTGYNVAGERENHGGCESVAAGHDDDVLKREDRKW